MKIRIENGYHIDSFRMTIDDDKTHQFSVMDIKMTLEEIFTMADTLHSSLCQKVHMINEVIRETADRKSELLEKYKDAAKRLNELKDIPHD